MAKMKYKFMLSFCAEVEVEAESLGDACVEAGCILDERSVYEDDKLEEMHDEAYCAGAAGGDPPLRKVHASSLRDKRFLPSKPSLIGTACIGKEEKDG